MYVDIDLTDPNLGTRLLEDPKGKLPIEVWRGYFWAHSGKRRPVLSWCIDPHDPDLAPIDPQRAVDEAKPLIGEVIKNLLGRSSARALRPAGQALRILMQGASDRQRKRGHAATMQHIAVRAYAIRKFNPDPRRPGESTVKLHELADKLFLEDGRCPRKIREEHGTRICGVSKHGYEDPCVEALMTAITHLKAAMKRDGIPV